MQLLMEFSEHVKGTKDSDVSKFVKTESAIKRLCSSSTAVHAACNCLDVSLIVVLFLVHTHAHTQGVYYPTKPCMYVLPIHNTDNSNAVLLVKN